MKFRNIIILLLLVVASASLSSCSAFRKKNRCNTCPTWDEVQISEGEEWGKN